MGDNGWNVIYAGDGNDGVDAEASGDVVHGGDGNDRLWGGNYNDTLLGENGNDKLIGGSGADSMSGQAGIDTADYSDETERVTVALNGLADDGLEGENDNVAQERRRASSAAPGTTR